MSKLDLDRSPVYVTGVAEPLGEVRDQSELSMCAPFWAAAEHHELVLQHCARCGAFPFYPRPFCLRCRAAELAWVPEARAWDA